MKKILIFLLCCAPLFARAAESEQDLLRRTLNTIIGDELYSDDVRDEVMTALPKLGEMDRSVVMLCLARTRPSLGRSIATEVLLKDPGSTRVASLFEEETSKEKIIELASSPDIKDRPGVLGAIYLCVKGVHKPFGEVKHVFEPLKKSWEKLFELCPDLKREE